MQIRIMPYKMGSAGARNLQAALSGSGPRCLRVRRSGGSYAPRDQHVLINWGCTTDPDFNLENAGIVLNSPAAVGMAGNKLSSFNCWSAFAGPDNAWIPDFTADARVADTWLEEGHTVVARTLLRANSGMGIVLCTPGEMAQVVKAPLYTKYYKKTAEYRAHVFCNEVIAVQQKKRKLSVPDEEVNWQIRNHANGFIFARQGAVLPDGAAEAAVAAVRHLGLDFGAIDLIFHEDYGVKVLEVNAAPGIEGSTAGDYAAAILRLTNSGGC